MENLKSILRNGSVFVSHVICFKKMKMQVCIFLISLCIIQGFTASASAMDFIVGAKGGYFKWDPYLSEIGVDQFEKAKGDGALYGPVFSSGFTKDISLSVSGLFGKQSSYWQSRDYPGWNPGQLRNGNFYFEAKRYDIDTVLNYQIMNHFKLFAGYKYQNYKIKFESVEMTYDNSGLLQTEVSTIKINIPNHGPAIGIGYSTSLGEKFFLTCNLSLLYMFGKWELNGNSDDYEPSLPAAEHDENTVAVKLRTRGINFEPAIGASMGEGLPIFTLGFRLQWTQARLIDPEELEVKSKWANDYLYGLFVSILYPF